MNSSLLAGVSGLRANQKLLDVAGNNLANVNTTAFKSSRVNFSDLLGETMEEASQPSATSGGTNPMQVGSGVQVASVDRNMQQGSLVDTGQPLDMAIEGAGYFVLNNGKQDVYTRSGAFAVDSEYYLVDPSTGFRVQRTGTEGVTEGFQSSTSSDIRIPYDVSLPAQATGNIALTGNLSADTPEETTNLLSSGIQCKSGGSAASADTLLTDLDGVSALADGDTISITGTTRAGTAVAATYTITTAATATVGDMLTAITAAFPGSTATMSNGEIHLTDDDAGYSQTDLQLEFNGAGAFEVPNYFTLTSAGGEATKNIDVDVFDSQGISHTLSATFVKTTTPNEWDMVLNSISGDVAGVSDRRINGLTFLGDGSFGGLGGLTPDTASFKLAYGNAPTTTREIKVNLGTVGKFEGLSQFGGPSTVTPSGQDGYASGSLSTVSVTSEGVLVGVFTNGARRNLAALKVATFQNSAGLDALGNNYYGTSANSGEPIASKALAGSAGSIKGSSLEKSNVEMAVEFVNLIQAQSGYQANATTIRTTSEMLRSLTNLMQ
jgi:flagellar hook protein FlgE